MRGEKGTSSMILFQNSLLFIYADILQKTGDYLVCPNGREGKKEGRREGGTERGGQVDIRKDVERLKLKEIRRTKGENQEGEEDTKEERRKEGTCTERCLCH
jgi:hypothetical protein